MKRVPYSALWLFSLLAILSALPLAAENEDAEATSSDTTAKTASPDEAVSTETESEAPAPDAMRVYRDPETGQLGRAKAVEKRALSPKVQGFLNRSSQGLSEEHRADGTVLLDLQGRFKSVSIARRTDAGIVVTDCVTNLDPAANLLEAEAVATDADRAEKE